MGGTAFGENSFWKTTFLKINIPKSIVFIKNLDGTTIVGHYLVAIWSLFGRYLVAIWSLLFATRLFGHYLVAIWCFWAEFFDIYSLHGDPCNY